MSPAPTIFLTVVGVILAVAVFAELRRSASQPIRSFRIAAAVALVLSFLPDFWLLSDAASSSFPGATIAGVGTLIVQHTVVAAVVVWLLTMRGDARLSESNPNGD
jgi:predicted acyltransferase